MAHQELTWPEAQSRYNTYNDVATNLRSQRAVINKAATATVPTSGFTGGALTGDYYNAYDQHVSLWIQEARGLQSDYSLFLSILDARISQAASLASTWQSRIGVTHTVRDSDDP